MTIPDGYTDLPPGKIASVVTYLEMFASPEITPAVPPPGLSVRQVTKPDLAWYRQLYRAVGQDWLWFSRSRMTDPELAQIIHHPRVQVFALADGNADKGLLELDGRAESEVEIAYLGLTADLVGRGAGQFLMNQALDAAWANKPDRVWVHTCTHDHPRALSFYLKAGFVPYKRAIEVTDDPRLNGDIPPTAAQHITILQTSIPILQTSKKL